MDQSLRENLPRYLTGFGAAFLSLYFLLRYRTDFTIVAASVFFLLASITDTLKTKIPNLLTLSAILAGFIINSFLGGWTGALESLLGLALGIGLLLLPYAMGGMGGGDAKALGALGTLVGPGALLHIFIYMALYGGGLAVLHYLFSRNLKQKIHEGIASVQASALTGKASYLKPEKAEPLRFPYAAAIAFGYYSYIAWGGIV